MESPNSTEPGKPVEPAPSVDTSQLFQKDPEPVMPIIKRNPLAGLDKKKPLILAVLLGVVLLSGGLAFAQFSKSAKESAPQQKSEEKVGNTTSTAKNDSTTEGQAPTSDDSTPTSTSSPSTSGTGTTNTSSGGSTSSNGGGSDGSSGSSETTATSPKTHYISYTNSCYSPANVNIKKGDTVKFTNNSSKSMWPASDNHPSHNIYPEFDANNSIAPGGTYSFTFNKTGVWDYHDHIKPSCSGTITIE